MVTRVGGPVTHYCRKDTHVITEAAHARHEAATSEEDEIIFEAEQEMPSRSPGGNRDRR
jgi:hypothetical protein